MNVYSNVVYDFFKHHRLLPESASLGKVKNFLWWIVLPMILLSLTFAVLQATSDASQSSAVSSPVSIQPTSAATSELDGQSSSISPSGNNVYICRSGLCNSSIGTDAVKILVDTWRTEDVFRGYGFSTDGTKILYGLLKDGSLDETDIYMINADGSSRERLFTVYGNNFGAVSGAGMQVLGFTQDNLGLIFEERDQVFKASLDGSNRQAITDVIPYNVSNTHYYYLSDSRTHLMRMTDAFPNQAVIYNINDGTQQRYEFDLGLVIIGFGRDSEHVLAARVEPPYDPDQLVNVAALIKMVLSFEEVNIVTGKAVKFLDIPGLPRMPTMIRANVSNGRTVFGIGGKYYFVDLNNTEVIEVDLPLIPTRLGDLFGNEVRVFVP
jgi:hypothetical protein